VTDSPQLVVSLFSLVAVPDPELMVTLPPQPRSLFGMAEPLPQGLSMAVQAPLTHPDSCTFGKDRCWRRRFASCRTARMCWW